MFFLFLSKLHPWSLLKLGIPASMPILCIAGYASVAQGVQVVALYRCGTWSIGAVQVVVPVPITLEAELEPDLYLGAHYNCGENILKFEPVIW